jgi:hypothetical protein
MLLQFTLLWAFPGKVFLQALQGPGQILTLKAFYASSLPIMGHDTITHHGDHPWAIEIP